MSESRCKQRIRMKPLALPLQSIQTKSVLYSFAHSATSALLPTLCVYIQISMFLAESHVFHVRIHHIRYHQIRLDVPEKQQEKKQETTQPYKCHLHTCTAISANAFHINIRYMDLWENLQCIRWPRKWRNDVVDTSSRVYKNHVFFLSTFCFPYPSSAKDKTCFSYACPFIYFINSFNVPTWLS